MLKKTFFFQILFLILTFYGCSSKNDAISNINYNTSFPNKDEQNLAYSYLYDALKKQYQEWRGVEYEYGGDSKDGIDCSAFVQRTFKEKLNINLPRTTSLQSEVGKEIPMEELKMGDLVFFKTGFSSKHVGIYLEGGKFLHASTKFGVTISRLDNIYYSEHFWKIIRVIK